MMGAPRMELFAVTSLDKGGDDNRTVPESDLY
jgi:hypothetical protein